MKLQDIHLFIFDRDGTIVEAMPEGPDVPPEEFYLVRLDQLKLLPGAIELFRAIKKRGLPIAIATNQPQITKGLLTSDGLEAIHHEMSQRLEGAIDKIYHCPHTGADNCICRKPKHGMLLQAIEEFGADPKRTVMIGDTDRDVLAGQAAGCRTIFLRHSQNASKLAKCSPDFIVDRLDEISTLLE